VKLLYKLLFLFHYFLALKLFFIFLINKNKNSFVYRRKRQSNDELTCRLCLVYGKKREEEEEGRKKERREEREVTVGSVGDSVASRLSDRVHRPLSHSFILTFFTNNQLGFVSLCV
jgi:hypothetical protein